MKKLTYSEAVERICARIAAVRQDAATAPWICVDPTSDESVVRRNQELHGERMLKCSREVLFEKAVSDPFYYDMLRFALAKKISIGLTLESDERTWVAEHLAGMHIAPKHRSRAYTQAERVREFGLRQFTIECVDLLVSSGMTATRNDASAEKTSACDAVAEAFSKFNLSPLSYSGIKKHWDRGKPAYRRQKK